MKQCGNCQHATPAPTDPRNIGAKPQLECRRFPPQVIALPVNAGNGMIFAPAACFPVVANEQHCGEWVEKPAATH